MISGRSWLKSDDLGPLLVEEFGDVFAKPSDYVGDGIRVQGLRRQIASDWGEVLYKLENAANLTGWCILKCIRDVRLVEAGRLEDVDDALGRDGAGDDLTHSVVQFLVRAHLARGALGQRRSHGLEERNVVADAGRLLMRDSEGERLLQLADDADEAFFAVFLREHVLLGRG